MSQKNNTQKLMSFEVWNEYQVIPTMWRDPDIRFGSQKSFFHHYQGSIDFNIVNIHPTAAMYLFVSTGNRNDIEWNDQQWS